MSAKNVVCILQRARLSVNAFADGKGKIGVIHQKSDIGKTMCQWMTTLAYQFLVEITGMSITDISLFFLPVLKEHLS